MRYALFAVLALSILGLSACCVFEPVHHKPKFEKPVVPAPHVPEPYEPEPVKKHKKG